MSPTQGSQFSERERWGLHFWLRLLPLWLILWTLASAQIQRLCLNTPSCVEDKEGILYAVDRQEGLYGFLISGVLSPPLVYLIVRRKRGPFPKRVRIKKAGAD